MAALTVLKPLIMWNSLLYLTTIGQSSTCSLRDTSLSESILIGSRLWVDVMIKQVVGGEVWPAGWRLLSQVDINGDTLALTAAVVQTFLHWLCSTALNRAHRVLIFVRLPLRVITLRCCVSTHYKLNYSIARYKHYGMPGYQKLMSILQGPKTVTVALTVAILIVYYSSYVLLCLISHVSWECPFIKRIKCNLVIFSG